ncbi:peptidase inhibitor family I36 protein [Plantactinospora sp. WMMB782]|uniref:peptidase inhibitor family I36 protein n=1 Tax=Plantactinospora sp. WMMB782 TaxID=3404121 RepID=UPI003B924AC9
MRYPPLERPERARQRPSPAAAPPLVALTRPAHTRAAVADCPQGWFCFYDRTSYGYPRGRRSDCGRQDPAAWGWRYRVESAHYNLSSGSVAFLYSGSRLFSVGAAARALGDVAPYRNWATHVHRYC